MDTIESLKKRRSVRSYQDKEISEEILREMVDCARMAPSARNEQLWEFVVVRDKDMLQAISEVAEYGKFIDKAAACIVVVCKNGKYYLEEGCAATENIMIAARSYGIGSCWVAGEKKEYAAKIAEMLGVPEGYKVISLIPMGYVEEFPESPQKRDLKEVIHWDKF